MDFHLNQQAVEQRTGTRCTPVVHTLTIYPAVDKHWGTCFNDTDSALYVCELSHHIHTYFIYAWVFIYYVQGVTHLHFDILYV